MLGYGYQQARQCALRVLGYRYPLTTSLLSSSWADVLSMAIRLHFLHRAPHTCAPSSAYVRSNLGSSCCIWLPWRVLRYSVSEVIAGKLTTNPFPGTTLFRRLAATVLFGRWWAVWRLRVCIHDGSPRAPAGVLYHFVWDVGASSSCCQGFAEVPWFPQAWTWRTVPQGPEWL